LASRTRERLIDVARQLFAYKGIENTTMNDIATASDRGRRTIYTYFRTKSDIYQAVIEDESARILNNLEETVGAVSEPCDKLRALMEYRIAIAVENAHGSEVWLRSLFSRDVKRANKIRSMVTDRIYEMIDEIVAEGVENGSFIPEQASRLSSMLSLLVRGSDWTVMRESNDESNGESYERWRRDCVDFIIQAVKKADAPTDKQTHINQQ